MYCKTCGSSREAEFTAEMIMHFPGLKNLDKPGVWLCSRLLLCLDCGCAQFTVPETELAFACEWYYRKPTVSP
jgi:hypothetical protein